MLLGIVENRSSEMGLSSKQVSCDLQAWNHSLLQANDVVTCTTTIAGASPTIRTSITNTNTTLELPKPPLKRAQPNQQQPEQLKCPRCDSSNTKFCYYNNYNKSQPRHFCKACKRHWTKGGTLRNVPVGGGRKNKRLKPSTTSGASGPTSTSTTTKRLGFTTAKLSSHTRMGMGIQSQDQRPRLPLSLGDDKIDITQTILQQDHRIFDNTAMDFGILKTSNSSGLFLGTSALALPQISQDHLGLFPYSSLTSLDENFSSSILNSSTSAHTSASHVYGYISDQSTSLEETPVVTAGLDGNISYNSMNDHPWMKSGDAAGNQLGWEEIDKFVSSDIMISWDDPDIK